MADVTKYATSDELKALTETLAAEKSAREATETKLAGIAETLKAIQEAQTQAAERDAEIAKFFEALGEEPTSSKTVHPAAAPVAVERAADTGNGGAGPVAIDTNKDYAKDAPASRAVLKSIYAEQK